MNYPNYNYDGDDKDVDDYDDSPLFTRTQSSGVASGNFQAFQQLAYSHPNVTEQERRRVDEGLFLLKHNLIATAMEDAIGQLRLMGACNNQIKNLKMQSDMTDLLGEKFGVEPSDDQDELAGIDHSQLYSERYKIYKLAADRALCEKLITATYLDLALRQKHGILLGYVKTSEERDEHYRTLIEDEVRNKNNVREVKKNLRLQRNRIRSAIYETDVMLEQIRSQIEDSTLQENVQMRYVDRWQVARSEQHMRRILNTEAGPSESISLLRRRFEEEQRVHSEVEMLANIQITETLTKLEAIMAKYDKDIEAIDIKIQRTHNNLDDKIVVRLEMENRLATHAEEMKDWIKFKTDRENERQYRLKMNNAAIAVQAWWRGLLVRLELGPYVVRRRRAAAQPAKKK